MTKQEEKNNSTESSNRFTEMMKRYMIICIINLSTGGCSSVTESVHVLVCIAISVFAARYEQMFLLVVEITVRHSTLPESKIPI